MKLVRDRKKLKGMGEGIKQETPTPWQSKNRSRRKNFIL